MSGKTSLVGELVKTFFLLLSFTFFILLVPFYLITGKNLFVSFSLSLSISLLLSTLYTFILKKKIENLLEKFYRITELISENPDNVEKLEISTYEELEEAFGSLKEAFLATSRRYKGKIKEIEMSYEPFFEKSSSLIKYIEQLKSGYLDVSNVPEGIDPVGAVGSALRESVEEIRTHIDKAKVLLNELHADFKELRYRLEKTSGDDYLEQKLRAIESIIIKLEKELSFFK